jgi:hypothetical protein
LDIQRPDNARTKKIRPIVYADVAVLFTSGVTIPVGPVAHQQESHIPVDGQQEATVPYSRLFLLIV